MIEFFLLALAVFNGAAATLNDNHVAALFQAFAAGVLTTEAVFIWIIKNFFTSTQTRGRK